MIKLKTPEQISKIKKAGEIIAKCHAEVPQILQEGILTLEIDDYVNNIILKNKGISIIKNYKGYPRYTCISVNNDVVHGVPGNYKIKNGDIVSVDISVSYEGFIADACKTYIVGSVDEKTKKLISETENAFWEGVKEIKERVRLSNISNTIEKHAKKNNLSVVKEFCGHGVGFELHEEPLILNYGKRNKGPLLMEGMVFAIEPIFCIGNPEIKIKNDGWTYYTKHGGNAAHYEHTLAVKKNGYEILTLID